MGGEDVACYGTRDARPTRKQLSARQPWGRHPAARLTCRSLPFSLSNINKMTGDAVEKMTLAQAKNYSFCSPAFEPLRGAASARSAARRHDLRTVL